MSVAADRAPFVCLEGGDQSDMWSYLIGHGLVDERIGEEIPWAILGFQRNQFDHINP